MKLPPRPDRSSVKKLGKFILPLWMAFLGYLGYGDLTRGFQRHDAFELGLALLVFVVLGVLLSLWFGRTQFSKGFNEGHEITKMAYEAAATQMALQARLTQATIEEYGFICDVCGGRDEEEGLEVGGQPGPGDPPVYFEVWVRCKIGDPPHNDLERYPPTNVVSTGVVEADSE